MENNSLHNSYDCIVIGGGSSGLMAAGMIKKIRRDDFGGDSTVGLDFEPLNVLLLERTARLGNKLRITGKGRCNLTNSADGAEFFDNICTNSSFFRSAFAMFDNADTMNFFENLGVPLKVERGNRVFPKSDSSHDIANALINFNSDNKVEVKYNCDVQSLIFEETSDDLIDLDGAIKHKQTKKVIGVKLANGEQIFADKVVIATGGKSYPKTGSIGGGYLLAESVGHKIIPPMPALVPLVAEEKWVASLLGLSLKNVEVSFISSNKNPGASNKNHREKQNKLFGEMIFTHFGVSGPIILSASSLIKEFPAKISIDLKPALTDEMLYKRITKDFDEFKNRDLINALGKLLPLKLIPVIIQLSRIDARTKVNSITKEQKNKLVNLIKNLTITISKTRGIDEGIITCGGVDVKEINPKTMESKLCKGLYFSGEVMDIDALTGGFNLQIAFSTGVAAARAIADV
ncbi:MAG: NAD(P)/FAD-dependent oxidoreductase [Clostridiales bacterium]|jgi:predicted Rossmann fold flavoprotein|nr:NAD(P)/FAD-dependent oxidoreductase [Clostridiales bacterium]